MQQSPTFTLHLTPRIAQGKIAFDVEMVDLTHIWRRSTLTAGETYPFLSVGLIFALYVCYYCTVFHTPTLKRIYVRDVAIGWGSDE